VKLVIFPLPQKQKTPSLTSLNEESDVLFGHSSFFFFLSFESSQQGARLMKNGMCGMKKWDDGMAGKPPTPFERLAAFSGKFVLL